MNALHADAATLSRMVRAREISAVELARNVLDSLSERDLEINSITQLTPARALRDAEMIDRKISAGIDVGPLAGVPYAAKNLFDVEGITTLAGSKINAELTPAAVDSTAVHKMREAGAVLIGTLNMDEYAYGFTTENSHYGAVHNPHDLEMIAGGSSGGSAASVAAGLVPLTLGSDTNGSVRLPAALCGTFGIRPTFGRISRAGAFPLSPSLDTVGAFSRTSADLAACYDALLGCDVKDPLTQRFKPEPVSPLIDLGVKGLRIAVAGGYFEKYAEEEALSALHLFASELKATSVICIDQAFIARAAAYVITAVEAGTIHLQNLRTRSADFEPRTVNRLIAGAISPAAWYVQAQLFREWFSTIVDKMFRDVDVILAPASPRSATPIGATSINIAGLEIVPRAYMGMLTQPMSLAGLPTITVPYVPPGKMPLGVQIIAGKGREDICFRVARILEQAGLANSPIAGCR